MNFSRTFIQRPVATTLLTIGIALSGIIGFRLLPVSPLPQVDFPTISVTATLPGASPETMAATVATPLERALGRIAGVTEITSNSTLGSARVVLQFDLERKADQATQDVRDKVAAALKVLPPDLEPPLVQRFDINSAPIIALAVSGGHAAGPLPAR